MRGGESKRCPGYATQRARAGAYARVRLPQFGRPERWPEHARAAHWTAAPSPPVLRADWPTAPGELGRAQRANAVAGFGGRLGASGMFLPLGAGGAARPAERAAPGPFLPFRRRHKMALGAEPRLELVGREALFPG